MSLKSRQALLWLLAGSTALVALVAELMSAFRGAAVLSLSAVIGLLVAAVIVSATGLWINIGDARRATDSREDSSRLSARLLEVQEEERRSLARELHDGVGQSVTALKMELSRITPAAGGDSAERLIRARALAGEVLEMIRNVSTLLRPTILDDLGLKAALDWHIQDFSKRTAIPATLACSLDDDDRLPETLRVCIYRVVQEALNNCEKHASATKVVVNVQQAAGAITVIIADNGRGMAPGVGQFPRTTTDGPSAFRVRTAGPGGPAQTRASARQRSGLGIAGMKERAGLAGGTLTIESSEGKGTSVVLKVPVTSGA